MSYCIKQLQQGTLSVARFARATHTYIPMCTRAHTSICHFRPMRTRVVYTAGLNINDLKRPSRVSSAEPLAQFLHVHINAQLLRSFLGRAHERTVQEVHTNHQQQHKKRLLHTGEHVADCRGDAKHDVDDRNSAESTSVGPG